MFIKYIVSAILFTLNTFCVSNSPTPKLNNIETKQKENNLNSFNNVVKPMFNWEDIIDTTTVYEAPTLTLTNETNTKTNIKIETSSGIAMYYYAKIGSTPTDTDYDYISNTTINALYSGTIYNVLKTDNKQTLYIKGIKGTTTYTTIATITIPANITETQLEAPTNSGIQDQNSYITTYRITNQNPVKVNLINETTNETIATIDSNTTTPNYIDLKHYWTGTETTATYKYYFTYNTGSSSSETASIKTKTNKYKILSTTYTKSSTTTITLSRSEKTQLEAPTLELLNNSYDTYELKITNPNSIQVETESTNTNLDNITINASTTTTTYKTKTINWKENETTITINDLKLSPLSTNTEDVELYATSNNATPITITRPEKSKQELNKPVIITEDINYTSYKIKIGSNNQTIVYYYINDTKIGDLDATLQESYYTYEEYQADWEDNQTKIDLTIKFIPYNKDYTESQTTISIQRPEKTTELNKPYIEITNNTTENYTIKVGNNNQTTVRVYINGIDKGIIEASENTETYIYKEFTFTWEENTTEIETTIKFTQNTGTEYTDSTNTITITKPLLQATIIENNYNYYKIQITNNTNTELKLYITNKDSTNLGNSLATIQPQQNTIYQQNWQINETELEIDIYLKNSNNTNTYKTTLTITRPTTTDLLQPTITNTNNNYQYATITIQNTNTSKVNLYINNYKYATLQANQTYQYSYYWENNTEKKLIIYFTNQQIETIKSNEITINLTRPNQQGNGYEVIDINGTLLLILTMPFSFLSQAFNFTLFNGTPYAFNVSQLILGVLGTIIGIYIIIWIINKVRK